MRVMGEKNLEEKKTVKNEIKKDEFVNEETNSKSETL